MARPASAERKASTMLSVRSCWMTRPRLVAHCGADTNFFFAASGLGEKQVGEIDAGNQEDKSNDAHHEYPGESNLAAIVGAHGGFGERSQSRTATGIIRGEGVLETSGNRFERSFRCGQGDSVFQATIHGGRQKEAGGGN